jgi:hypothetical protein
MFCGNIGKRSLPNQCPYNIKLFYERNHISTCWHVTLNTFDSLIISATHSRCAVHTIIEPLTCLQFTDHLTDILNNDGALMHLNLYTYNSFSHVTLFLHSPWTEHNCNQIVCLPTLVCSTQRYMQLVCHPLFPSCLSAWVSNITASFHPPVSFCLSLHGSPHS